MKTGSSYLQYDLFKFGTTQLWGPTGSDRVTSTTQSDGVSTQTLQYRAQIYADQTTPPVGHYTDVIVVDVSF